MATATRKRSRASSVTPETVSQAIAYLEDLPEKAKEDLSLKESVVQMQDQIKAALAKGYSYDDIAKLLSDKGIKISALTLKNYVPSGKRQANKTSNTKTRRPRKSSGDTTASAASATQAASTETATESAPARGRRGRTKSVAAEAAPETTTRTRATRTRKATTKSEAKAPTNGRRRKAKS